MGRRRGCWSRRDAAVWIVRPATSIRRALSITDVLSVLADSETEDIPSAGLCAALERLLALALAGLQRPGQPILAVARLPLVPVAIAPVTLACLDRFRRLQRSERRTGAQQSASVEG